jgi:tetratricopeptide (TPR) repeat protein
MKTDTARILEHLACDNETDMMRGWLLRLDATHPEALQLAAIQLNDAIRHATLKNHDNIGLYRLFVACLLYELDNYEDTVKTLQLALHEILGTPKNKPLVYWLLGLSYSNTRNFPEARRNLQEALHILATQARRFSPDADIEQRKRYSLQQDINDALEKLFNEPLFRTVLPDPNHTDSRFPLQPAPADEGEGTSISINLPVNITNENNPVNTINNQNRPNTTFDAKFKPEPFEARDAAKHPHEEVEYETRTDTDADYMVLPSQVIYEQKARAGNSGEPELIEYSNRHPEITQITLNGINCIITSLRSGYRINPTLAGEWAWMQVTGHSMNKTTGNASIEDGDFVLLKKSNTAADRDIVVAILNDERFKDHMVVIKRYLRATNQLISETNEPKNSEYAPIDLSKIGCTITGVVYAVAKPIR